jgi:hypothetical protein
VANDTPGLLERYDGSTDPEPAPKSARKPRAVADSGQGSLF